ncbi:MAG TPA: triose-phosphate isomerase [Candidatus Binataceae bacterium]|nr:triose-phosphate isomerase [Candidatus Binataceae bacterium]
MRRKLIAGNWKMNLSANDARAMIAGLRTQIDPLAAQLAKDRDLLIAPTMLAIPAVAQALAGSSIALGAQNVHWEDSGAFTGEVSAPMLKAFGVTHAIIGHSERRHLFLETDEFVNKKVKTALKHRMAPIMCVGETLQEREASKTLEVVMRQMENGLSGIPAESAATVVIAYEPVWAIGTGKTATPEQAQLVHGSIREFLDDLWGKSAAAETRIVYGGSVTPDNIDSLLAKPDIDGALVGGASLKADSCAKIFRAGV